MCSDKFTPDDIHRIRFENFEKTKHMTPEELIENTKRCAETGKKCLKQSVAKEKM